MANAEGGAKMALNVSALQLGVTIRMQQALLGGQTGAATVDVDGAAFEDHTGLETRHAEARGDALR